MISFDWIGQFGYFITYIGDIHLGIAITKTPDADSFYILGKNHLLEYNKLLQGGDVNSFLDQKAVFIETKEIIHDWIPEHKLRLEVSDRKSPWSGNHDAYKTMYVFGAGASANCLFREGKKLLEESSLRPPIGKELFSSRFDPLIIKYQGLRRILPKFELNNNDIEETLENDWNDLIKKKNIELSAQHIQLQFFLQELFRIISKEFNEKHFRYSLPTVFVQKLFRATDQNSKPVIISFNYDSILDEAVESQLRMRFDTVDKYVSQGDKTSFLFFKPHGSWNWGWEFNEIGIIPAANNVAKWIYDQGISPAEIYYGLLRGDMITSSSWGIEKYHNPEGIGKITPNRDLIKVCKPEKQYFPALLLPYRDKDEFVMPYYHQILLDQIIPHIDELILIGWKGNEKLFNTKLKKSGNKIKKITIANPYPKEVTDHIGNYIDLENCDVVVANDFEDYVLNHMK